ncbi:MAG TPA: UGSC family (seleno)protein, partial [Candidatus Binatia bacterium]|nr:UGSC family (seleno)protein [Candidatus Binatia bacterium]
MGGLPLVEVPHPIGTISNDALRKVAETALESILTSLTQSNVDSETMATSSAQSRVCDATEILTVPRDPAALFHFVMARGWSDGLPVLPPTRAAVDAMIGSGGLPKGHVLGIIPPLNGIATIEKIAANAVMAGCLPQYFPLALAGVKGMLQPGFNLDGVQTTTGNVAPLAIVNGPCRKALEINCGANVLGQGWRANATIGRAIRFVMINIGGAVPGLYDKSTVGQPAKYTFCFGENEEESPWEPLHVERGLNCEANTVSMFGCSGVNSAVDMASQNTKGLLKTFALTMIGGMTSGVTSTEVMLVICPEHAQIMFKEGYSKGDIRAALFAMARVSFEKISDENLELLSKRRSSWFKTGGREIGVVDRPE